MFIIRVEFDGMDVLDKVVLFLWVGVLKIVFLSFEVENKEIRGWFKKVFWGGILKSF